MPEPKEKVKFEKKKLSVQEKKEEKEGIPKYFSELELKDDKKKLIVADIILEYLAIKKERADAHLEEKWQGLDDQDEGNIEESEDRQFNLHKHTTRVKVDAVAGALTEASLDSDPLYSISARPEFAKEGGREVCEHQQDFLDNKIDTVIPMRPEMAKVDYSTALKGTGILKLTHRIKREDRKREEVYEGKKGAKEFKLAWPEEAKKHPEFIEALEKGGKKNWIVSYKDTTYNDPYPQFIDLKNFFVRLDTNGYEGLKTTKLIVEKQEYTWWELKQMENDPDYSFFDVDKLMFEWDKGKKRSDRNEEKDLKKFTDYKTRKYTILECVFYFKDVGEDGKEVKDGKEIKGVFWLGEEREVMIGSIYYPYWGLDSYYFPKYIKHKVSGFYQPGVGEDLTDSNIAEDALLNFILEGAWSHNIFTPITDSDEIEAQFLNKQWTHGIPIKKKKQEFLDFLNKYKQPFDINGLVGLLQYLVRGDDDVSGVSSLMTGRESEFDPSAPGIKTMALLRESGKNIKRYILNALPMFNEVGNALLQIYYQISKAGRKYRIRPERVVGDNPFDELSRAEMVARTNIESRAMTFDFDKLNAKREVWALYQMIRPELLISRDPKIIHFFLKLIIKSWGPMFKNAVDELLPPLEQLKKEEMQLVNQALVGFIQAQVLKAKTTGQEPEFPLEPLMALVAQTRKEMATPPTKEEVKAREKK